jgi:hypothetical protein
MNSMLLFQPVLGQTPDKILISSGEIFNSDGTRWRNYLGERMVAPRLSPDSTPCYSLPGFKNASKTNGLAA